MRKLVLVAAGGAVGYVLGARAGRPAYDRILRVWHGLSDSVGLTDVSRSVGRSAVDLRDAAKDRATTQVSDLMDRATDAVAAGAPAEGERDHLIEDHGHADHEHAPGSNGQRRVEHGPGEHQTIVAPTPGT